MGLFSFIKGELIEVIEWVDDSRDTVVWKFPDNDKNIKMGAQLTVRESQVALFINEGRLADVFLPGRHELVTRNMPLLTSLRSWKMGFDSPFKVDIYFVNTRQFSNLKWGTPAPIMVTDPEFPGAVPMRAFGTYTFRVKDAAQFFREFAGTDPNVTSDEVMEHFRGRLVSTFAATLKRSGQSLTQIYQQSHELGASLLPLLAPDFESVGCQLVTFNVENVSLPEEIQRQLTEQDLEARSIRRVSGAQMEQDMQRKMQENMIELQRLKMQAEMSQNMEDMQKFLQFQAAIGMQTPGQGGSTGGMMQNMMEMGVGMNMAQQMIQGLNQPSAKPAAAGKDMSRDEVMQALKELGELKTAGILTEDEFNEKKKELLARL